ncbi:MAG: alpha/beta hydrolase, partial [Chloroflexi bacterium]|nr:alpha/beta hydrolase [Chloroflexota bacterium]
DMMGWAKDLGVVIDYMWFLRQVDRSRFCLMGFSGGAAVSTYVAANDSRVSRVVLCACPAEFRGLIEEEAGQSSIQHFRRIGMIRDAGFPPSLDDWLHGFKQMTPLQWVDKISPRPLLLLQGTDDDLVEASHTYRLYEKAKEPKEMAFVDGGGHKLRLSEKAMDIAIEWLRQT